MVRPIAGVVLLGLAVALPVSASAGSLEVRLGGFFPRAQSDLFSDASELYTVGKNDWRGFSGGVEWSFNLAPKVEMGFHVDGYERKVHTAYRDFEDEAGRDILQTLQLRVAPIGASIRFVPLDRRAAVSPYVTVGGDVFLYRYEAFGDFIDFFDDSAPIYADSFLSEGAAFGFHVAGGVRVPLGRDFSLVGEVRYQHAKADMEPDFDLNRLDMSGTTTTVGLRLKF